MERDYAVAKKPPHHRFPEKYASKQLDRGKIYTRVDLRLLFKISDMTINTGIFKPPGFDSVWIFLTENKTKDRTQFEDRLTGATLFMDGQRAGRTDWMIQEHVEHGLELLVFYRKSKHEHPQYGFTYEGKFLYQNHKGSLPAKFILSRENGPALTTSFIEMELKAQGEFDPDDVIDARKRILASLVRRQGQSQFRSELLSAYQRKCAVTGCSIEALLEAAHITPYQGINTNRIENGLLLRADIHTLFDLGLLWIDPDSLVVKLSPQLAGSEYEMWQDKRVALPQSVSNQPSIKALRSHLNELRVFKGVYSGFLESNAQGGL